MTTQIRSQINRLEKEIADLRVSDARNAKKEVDIIAKINRAQHVVSSARNESTLQAKVRELERFSREMASLQKKRADAAKKISDKSRTLASHQDKQLREDEKTRKKAIEEERKVMKEREAHERRIRTQRSVHPLVTTIDEEHEDVSIVNFDFFVCHASEDKDFFVNELVENLNNKGANIWYDNFALKVGDSLRREIDRGLLRSRYGIVILSENFFKKEPDYHSSQA